MRRIEHLFAGVAVSDFATARAWYDRFFARPPDFDVSDNEAMWQVVESGWIYVVGDARRAGTSLLTLLVSDLDETVAALADRGIVASEIETEPGLYRKAVVTDPSGNSLSLGENLNAAKPEDT